MAGKTRKKGRGTVLYRSGDPITGEPSAGGAGGTGAPPAEKPGGGGAPGGGSGAPGSGEPSIPLDVLPESLRGKPATEIKFTLDTLVKSVTAANARNKQLEDELRSFKTKPAPKAPEEEAPKGALSGKALADRLLDKPEEALEEFFRSRANPYAEQIKQLNERLGNTEVDLVRNSVPDFDEYQEQVFKLLDDSGSPRTREALMGAYTMVIGQKAIEQRELERRKAVGGSEAPAPESQKESEKKYPKSPLSEEIRLGLGMSEEDYYEKYSKPDSFSLKVPT